MALWPAPVEALEAGRAFLRRVVDRKQRLVVVPDKDADGLCAGSIIARTLAKIGQADVVVSPVAKGEHVHQDAVRRRLEQLQPQALVVADLGSRAGPILPSVPTLLIDHHRPEGFPDDALVVSAHSCEPVATSSLLAYVLCRPLHPSVASELTWLALVGTAGDLTVEGIGRFAAHEPELAAALRTAGKTNVGECVSLLNAARRAPRCDVGAAWAALQASDSAAALAKGSSPGVALLRSYREAVKEEVARCARTPPRFSDDGRLALLRISSEAQVHPVIAQRWVGRLRQGDRMRRLQAVVCSNDAYLPGRVNFSMRRAGGGVDLIALLKEAAGSSGVEDIFQLLGEDYARGHAEATGGSVSQEAFPVLLRALAFSEQGLQGKHKQSAAAEEQPGSSKQRKVTSFFLSSSKK